MVQSVSGTKLKPSCSTVQPFGNRSAEKPESRRTLEPCYYPPYRPHRRFTCHHRRAVSITTSLLKHPFYIAVSFTAVPVVAATVSSAPSAPAIIGPTTIHTSGRRDAPSSFVAPTLSTFISSATATPGHESLVLQSPSVLHHAVAPRVTPPPPPFGLRCYRHGPHRHSYCSRYLGFQFLLSLASSPEFFFRCAPLALLVARSFLPCRRGEKRGGGPDA